MTDRDIEQMVQAFLDGELPPAQQDDFDRALAQDPELRRRVHVLEAAQDALRRSYAPVVASTASHGPAAREQRTSHRRSRRRMLVLVTSLAVVALAFLVQRQMTPPADPVSASMAYAAFMQSEQPTVVCDTPAKLIAYTTKMLGVGLTADFDAGVELIGWRRAGGSYDAETEPGDPLVLLAKRDDGTKAVVIFQDSRIDAPTVRSMDTLTVTPKRFGRVTAWEVGTIEDVMVLPLLREAH
jgi:hypothetical protein